MLQDTTGRVFGSESGIPSALTVSLEPMGPMKSLLVSMVAATIFVLLMAVAVHVVMSLQKNTAARSAFWRALVASGIASVSAV